MPTPQRLARVFLALLLAALSPWHVSAAEPAEDLAAFSEHLTSVAERCRAATVGIVIPGGSMGSGVIIDHEGLVLTAAHVLPEAGGEVVIVTADGKQHQAVALGVNRGVDSGMARINDPGTDLGALATAPVADADTMWEGDWCIAFGHGGGVQTDRPAPMRLGRVLHISSRTEAIRWVTTDSTVISGDSGGPLFNLEGEVIGIHSNIGMSVLVNRHVPIGAYHAQWDALLKPEEINEPPAPKEPLIAGLENLPDGIEREIARRLNEGDEALREQIEALRDQATGKINASPEQMAEILGHAGTLDQIRQYQEKIRARQARADQIENAGQEDPDQPESEVSRRSAETRAMIVQKLRERALENIADELRRTHGKIAEHVLTRFAPAVSASGSMPAVEIITRGKVVALGTVVREDGYIVTKASEVMGPPRVRIGDQEYRAQVVTGDGGNDLVLLKIDAEGLAPVRWAEQTPALGSLLVVPTADGQPLAMGIVGVDARPIPKRINNVDIPPPPTPYLGVSDLTAVTPDEAPDEEAGEDGADVDGDGAADNRVEGEAADDTEQERKPEQAAAGVRVGSVVEGDPAGTAGMKAGDIITAVNGEAVESVDALIETIQSAEVGDELKLAIQRGDETVELTVTLGERAAPPRPQPQDDRQSAAQVYSARGGKLSERRTDFPLALTHDAVIWAGDIGGPVLNLDGEAVGLNIARYGRTATYALPAEHARQAIEQMMRGR